MIHIDNYQRSRVFWCTIKMPPRPKPRPRFSKANNKSYTPTDYKKYEDACVERIKEQVCEINGGGALPLAKGVPVDVVLTHILRRPKRLYKKTVPDGHLMAPVRPDIDNLNKAIYDAIGRSDVVWHDDAQICDQHCFKRYSDRDEEPYTVIEVYAIHDC